MKNKFKLEFDRNSKWGVFALAIGLIALAGFYFHAVQMDFNNECSFCITSDCMDNNPLCGDFGIYYFKFFILAVILSSGITLLLTREYVKK